MRRAIRSVVAAVVILVSACNTDPQTRAARDLAGTVRVDGYRKVAQENLDRSAIIYFVGPADADLHQAFRTHGYSPELPPSSDLPEPGAFSWEFGGSSVSSSVSCRVMVGRLRPGFEDVAIELTKRQSQELMDGTLAYVEVAILCNS